MRCIQPNTGRNERALLIRIRMQLPPKHTAVIFGLSVCCLVSAACSDLLKKQPTDSAVAAHLRVIDCEWKAADQYDDNRYKTFSELVQQVMAVCAAELREARSAYDRSPSDKLDKDEFEQAAEIIGNARNRRQHAPPSPQGTKNSAAPTR
jgi:hypothetical protein